MYGEYFYYKNAFKIILKKKFIVNDFTMKNM